MVAMINAIEVRHLAKKFGSHEVLRDVSFEVRSGSIFALLGSNGSGKTTTVNILSTLMLPDAGDVSVGGFNVVAQDQEVRGRISLTGQYAALDELLTGEENLLMMGSFSHIDAKAVKTKTKQLLKQLDLEEAAGRTVDTYSGGMRRRLDLAVSLLAASPIIFLDEPTTGLDPRSRQEVWRIVKDLAKSGVTIFLTTQYLEEADQLADYIAVLHEGQIVASGTAAELKRTVGGEVIELTFANSKSLEQAQKILAGSSYEVRQDESTLLVSTDGSPTALREVLNALHQAALEPSHLQLHSPTLDDVFMQLTNHKTETRS